MCDQAENNIRFNFRQISNGWIVTIYGHVDGHYIRKETYTLDMLAAAVYVHAVVHEFNEEVKTDVART